MEVLILICCLVISLSVDKKWYSPSVIFTTYWTLLLIMAKLRLFDLYAVSQSATFMIVIGVLFFDIACWVHRFRFVFKTKGEQITNLNWKTLNMSFYVALVGMMPVVINAIGFILSGATLAAIRYELGDAIFPNYFIKVWFMFISYPIVYMFVVLLGVTIVCEPLKIKECALKTGILTVVSTLIMGNQRTLFFLFSVLLISFIISKRKLSPRIKRLIYIILVAVVVGVLFIIYTRGTFDLFEGVYKYFVGAIVYLSEYVRNNEPDYLLVTSTFQGIIRPIANVLEKVGINWELFLLADEFLYELQETVYYITPINYYNLMATCFLYFYNDLGWLGVVIYSFIYGWICKGAYMAFKRKKTSYSYGIFVFYVATILMATLSFVFVRAEIAYALIFFIILNRRHERS